MNLDIVDVDTTEFERGTVIYKGSQPLSAEKDDEEPIRGDAFQCLGLHAACAPATTAGKCEMMKVSGIGGLNDSFVGGRDTRVGPRLGRMDPGDTVLLSTDPETDVQVRCHGKRKQAVIFAREGGATSPMATLMIDAKNKKFQFLGFKGVLEYSEAGGWIMRDKTGSGFNLNNGMMSFNCQGKLTPNPAGLPLRMGPAAIGGAPIPGWFGMVAYFFLWLRVWLWQRMPKLPDAESA